MFSESQTQKGLRISIWEGAFATVHGTVTTGAFLTGFALMLGANDFEIGLLTAIPLVTQMLQILSVHVMEQVGHRKWLCGWFACLGRSLWALAVLIPLIPAFQPQAITLFLFLFTVISSLLSFSGAPWLSWMADLVPAPIRGRYFGRRNMIMGLVTMSTSIIAGQILDHYKRTGHLAHGFLMVELGAVGCGIIAFSFLTQQPEPPYQRSPSYTFVNYVLQPFRTEKFRKLLSFYLFWTFAIGVASGYFPVYLLKTLNWSFSNLALLSIGSSTVTLITQPLWGRILDRVGHKPVIKTTVAGILPLPLLYLVATPTRSWPVWLDIFFTGIFWSGFNLAMFNMVIYSLPQQGRPGFLAVHSALTGLINFVAMVSGGTLAQALAPMHLSWWGQTVVNYHVLFLLTFLLRLSVFPLINTLEEPEAKPVGVMIRWIFLTINRHIGLGHSFWFLNSNQIPNDKSQITNKSQISNTNSTLAN